MLGATKQENMQWVFAYGEGIQCTVRSMVIVNIIITATSRFSEAIMDFLADEQRATEARIRAEDFEGEAYSIYELFSTIWLQSKESKVHRLSNQVMSLLHHDFTHTHTHSYV